MDPISNMLNSIINAQKVKKERVAVPYSSFKEDIANFLQQKGVIAKTRVQEGKRKRIVMSLIYDNNQPAIQDVKKISKPGNRRHITGREIPYTGHRPGMYIISTSQGLMDQDEARAKSVGGELLCAVWLNF